jgi:hypothetical protein
MTIPAALALLTTTFTEGATRDRVLGFNGALLSGGSRSAIWSAAHSSACRVGGRVLPKHPTVRPTQYRQAPPLWCAASSQVSALPERRSTRSRVDVRPRGMCGCSPEVEDLDREHPRHVVEAGQVCLGEPADLQPSASVKSSSSTTIAASHGTPRWLYTVSEGR